MEMVENIITWLLIVLSWGVVPWLTERRRKEAEIGIWRHTAMSEAHKNLVKILHEIEQYFNELLSYQKCEANELKMGDKELSKANSFVDQINTELDMMYMIMPDNQYQVVRDTIKPEQKTTLCNLREKMLVAMRKAQFTDTKFNEPKDIRFFYLFERPDKL